MELDDTEIELVREGEILVNSARHIAPREDNHPWFEKFEWNYAEDAATVALQAESDMELIRRTMAKSTSSARRAAASSAGRRISEFAGKEPFFDEHVYVLPRSRARTTSSWSSAICTAATRA